MIKNHKFHVTKKGYARGRVGDVLKLKHRLIWEEYHGKVPRGYQIHHKDGNRLNNDIGNLELVTPLEHKRLHSGCIFIKDVWYKPCRKCGLMRSVDEYYKVKTRRCIQSICKKCQIRKSIENKNNKVGTRG